MAEKTSPQKPNTPPAGERIAKVLSRAGVASRREAERMIELGEVAVNGAVITSPALNVTAADKITVRGKAVSEPEPARLWLYYKPEGLVTSESDEKGRETVFANLPEDMPRVMSVGRLDLNSEGLLLLTNDGGLKRRLELPSTGWLRKYRVRVNGNPMDPDLEPLRKGIEVDGERFQPMQVAIDRIQGANAWLTVGLREGKNREIRRALSAIGLTVNRLIRISYGPFRLGDLVPGATEEIKPRVLREQLGDGAKDPGDAPARPRGPTRSLQRETKIATERSAAISAGASPSEFARKPKVTAKSTGAAKSVGAATARRKTEAGSLETRKSEVRPAAGYANKTGAPRHDGPMGRGKPRSGGPKRG
jgi:23S rRNA pseudouridine2605 synthase